MTRARGWRMLRRDVVENSRHRQEERTLGQVKRDCKLYDRMDRRTKSP